MTNKARLLLLAALLSAACPLGVWAQNYTKYLFAYFPSNDNENIYYALSTRESPFDFTPMNNGQMVVSADTIALKKGVRDPHVLRGEDGWFYMVNTDMRCAEGWASNRGIVLMRSRDLVNWQHSTVHFPEKYAGTHFANVTRVWAPETIWDPVAKKYMVYFSLLTNDGTIPYDKVYYCYANDDFTDLIGEPTYFYDRGSATIDMDIVFNEKDGLYHAFYKNEGSGGICKVTAASLTPAPGQAPGSQWSAPSGTLQQTRVAVEGAGVWRLIDSDTWILMYDCYGSGYYQFCESQDLTHFKLKAQTNTSGMFTPRHGTVLPVTDAEVATIEKALNARLLPGLKAELSQEAANAQLLGIDVSQAMQLLQKDDLTPADLTAMIEQLKLQEYDAVQASYTSDVTRLLGEWTMDNVSNKMKGQHWNGSSTRTYYEQDQGWNAKSWSMAMSQQLSLPAGQYVLKVACRAASAAVDACITVGNASVAFPQKGDTGRGIDTSGKASFADGASYANNGAGRGWEWRYVPFTVGANGVVHISITGHVDNAVHQWMSFTDISLLARTATGVIPVHQNGLENRHSQAMMLFDLEGRLLAQGTQHRGRQILIKKSFCHLDFAKVVF
jgi:hypothetical protein